jgi:hypothetical protein
VKLYLPKEAKEETIVANEARDGSILETTEEHGRGETPEES